MEDSRLFIGESSPEVRSFICQQVQDFESFMTPKSVISVISKEISGDDEENCKEKNTLSEQALEHFYKVTISISDGTAVIEEEAISSNIFEAVTIAKTKLYNNLIKIQDEVVTVEDRAAQLLQAKNSIMH